MTALQVLAGYAVVAFVMFLLTLCIALARNETVWVVIARCWRDYMKAFNRIGAALVPTTAPRRGAQQTTQERALAVLTARFVSESAYELDEYERDVEKVLRRQ